MDIAEAIRTLAKSETAYAVYATVASINGIHCTVSPVDGSADIEDVRLQAAAGNGVLIIPKVGSVVAVQMVNDIEGYISMFSDVDSIQWLDGSFGGIVKVTPLTEKINNLETQMNSILDVLKNTTIPLAPSGTYPFASLYASINPLNPTTENEIKSDKITHGTV